MGRYQEEFRRSLAQPDQSGAGPDPGTVTAELVTLVRDQIGPVAALRPLLHSG